MGEAALQADSNHLPMIANSINDHLTRERLEAIAERVREAIATGRAQTAAGLRSYMEAGDELIKAKQLLAHGEWGKWLAEHCDLSPRTARLYMQLANNRDAVESKMATVADLTIAEALGLRPEVVTNVSHNERPLGKSELENLVHRTQRAAFIALGIAIYVETCPELGLVGPRHWRGSASMPWRSRAARAISPSVARAKSVGCCKLLSAG
jgi:hypothetical protein